MESLPEKTYCLAEKILRIKCDVAMKEINCEHNAKCSNFYLYQFLVDLTNQALQNNFDFCLSDAVGISALFKFAPK